MKIMALDLGKNKTAVCEFAVETSEVRYLSVKTRRAEIEGLLDRLRPDRVVMEVGPIAGWVSDLVRRRGLELEVANPSTEGWRWRNVKKKTDRLDALGEADERVKLLRTMDGVGPRLSEAVVAILDDPHRFRNGRQVGSIAGLAPRGYQSGQSQRMGRISKADSGLLRKLLVQVSWLGLRNNAWMRETYQRIHRGIKTWKKIAIVAVARRLLVVLWAMMRDGQRWRRPEPPAAASEPEQPRGLQALREFLGCQAAPE